MKKFFLTLTVVLISVHFLFSQKKVYQSERIYDKDLKINGILDENIWNKAEWVDNFTQNKPHNGAKPTQKTEFKILYDDDNIYVAVKAYDNEPEKIDTRMSRRDGWDGDRIAVHFDSYFDKRTSFNFSISAGGVKNDAVLTNDGRNWDDTWDPIWFVKTKITDYGWNAEIKIPLSQLRFSNKKNQTWGLQIVRAIYRNQESDYWQHIEEEDPGFTSKFGELRGISNVMPKRQVEVAPYVMSKVEFYEKEEGNPFANGSDFKYDAGIDGKIGITNDLTLNFAINPDFGQVEADPSEVNLTAFETFFDEKRLFFVEGKNITDYQFTPGGSPWSRDNLFYSRRIGRSPQGNAGINEGEYADIPQNTRILGALKLTGKTQKGWSVGIIESVTNQENTEIDNNGYRSEEIVEPYTNFFLGRVQKDINKGNTIIGGMFTSVYREIPNENLLFLNKTATTGGLDFMQYFKDKKYYILAKASASYIAGDKEAILNQQLSSRRYFQRPDADYFTLDSGRTSLSGHAGTFSFGKNANSGLRYSFAATWRSPGFETNDLGYLRRANTLFQYLWVSYVVSKPFSIFRRIQINSNQWAGWDFGGTNTFTGGNINFWTQFKNLWSFNANFSREGKSIDNTALRGGPALYSPGAWNYNIGFATNPTKKINANAGSWYNTGDNHSSKNFGIYSNITYRPSNMLSVSVAGNYNSASSDLQYVTQEAYNGEERYIFAGLNQETFIITTRINFNITPDLTIQLYASPFISGGLYSDFKKITDPKAESYNNRFYTFSGNEISYINDNGTYGISENNNGNHDYNIGNPDFNFRRYNSNLVLRWEYSPGSLFYIVWSQARIDFASDGTFSYFNDVKNLFSADSEDVLLLKLSYRFRT